MILKPMHPTRFTEERHPTWDIKLQILNAEIFS